MRYQCTKKWWQLKLKSLRVLAFLFPPVALVLLWLSPFVTRREKKLGSIGIPVFFILYLSLGAWLLDVCFGFKMYEWRGGYNPTLMLWPTIPNFDTLEVNRSWHRERAGPLKPPGASDAPWPSFRGENRDGHYDAQPILTNWPATGLRQLWRQPIGGGYASFAVAMGRAFTIEQRRSKEVVTAYDVEMGVEVWAHEWMAEFQEPIGGNGPRATPAFADGLLYALGGLGELHCLDARTGELVWRRNTTRENRGEVLEYGTAASPLVVDNKVIILSGGTKGRAVVAYDCLTGKILWHTMDDEPSYASPMVVALAGQRQLLVVFTKRTVGLDLETGKQLWEFKWGEVIKGRNIAQPVLWNGNRFLLSAGYNKGCTAVEVSKVQDTFSVRELWSNRNLKNKFASSVFWQGCIYGLDEEILTCVDADTGLRRWKDGRYGYGQLLLASGHLIIVCGNGDLALVRATPSRHEEVARVPGISGKTWNYPAMANGRLLIRNAIEMACYDLSTK